LDGLDSTSFTTTSSFNTVSSSFSTRVANTEATASAYIASSGSFSTRTTNAENYIAAINAKTGSYATTGSNYFIGTQVITGSVYIANDLIVQGSSSLQNITASAVSIGTNTVILNTDSPAVRFAGISVRDSGSNSSVTSSIWYDSLNNKWIYQNESGSSYSGGMFISGPRNTGSLGSEAGMDSGYIAKGLGGDHIGPSIIFESGSNIGIGTSNPTAKLEVNGTGKFSGSLTIGSTTDYVVLNTGNLYRTSGSGYGSVNITGRNVSLQYDDLSTGAITGLLVQSGSGNVGIGSSSPTVALDVAGVMRLTTTSSVSILLNKNTATAGASAQLYFHDQGVGKWDLGAFNMGAAGVNDFSLYNRSGSGSNPITVLYANSNVGIGTVTPGAKFEVWQSANNRLLVNYVNISNEPQISSLDSAGNPQYLTINSYDLKLKTNGTTALTLSSAQAATFASTVTSTANMVSSYINGGGYKMKSTDGTNGRWWWIGNDIYSYGDFAILQSGGASDASYTSKFRIDSSGNIGIGTTSPSAKLNVSGDIHIGDYGNAVLRLLDLRTSNSILSIQTDGTSGALGTNVIYSWANGGQGPLRFSNASGEVMRLAGSGNVGIGTTNPSKLLSVNGRMGTTAIVSSNIIAGNITSNIASSPSFILIVDLNNAAGFSMSGKSNAASYTCWNISDFWIKKDYSSTTAAAGITGAYKSGCDFSIVDINYGSSRYIALRFTGNPEIDLMCTGYRLAELFAANGEATVVTGATVNSTLASY
jgi:hypothetical protein